VVTALDVDDGELELGDGDALLGAEVDEILDLLLAFEIEERVEQLDEQVLVRLGAEDTLEDEVGLGVGEDGPHRSMILQERLPGSPVGPKKTERRGMEGALHGITAPSPGVPGGRLGVRAGVRVVATSLRPGEGAPTPSP
jgi:hypothetical protein